MRYDRGTDWSTIKRLLRRPVAGDARAVERLLKIRGGGRSQAVASALAPPAPQHDPVERVRRRRLERLERQRVGIRGAAAEVAREARGPDRCGVRP